jgi:hypothetical protein
MVDNNSMLSTEELQKEWFERRKREKQPLPPENPALNARPVDQNGNPLSFDSMKEMWNKRQGKGGNWEVEDNTIHEIDTPKPSEGRLRDDKGNFIDYATAREKFFALQGRKDPLIAKRQHDNLTKNRNSKY